jgi:hypothetical protein
VTVPLAIGASMVMTGQHQTMRTRRLLSIAPVLMAVTLVTEVCVLLVTTAQVALLVPTRYHVLMAAMRMKMV